MLTDSTPGGGVKPHLEVLPPTPNKDLASALRPELSGNIVLGILPVEFIAGPANTKF